MLLVVLVVALVVAVATYLTWIASRLDRLAVRVEGLWAALDGQLSARAFAAHELAHQVDDVVLHAAARAAGAAEGDDREVAENRLSRALRAALPEGIDETSRDAPALSVAAAGIPASGATSGRTSVAAHLPPRAVDDPVLAHLPECAREAAIDLEVVLVKVALARHFYNDAVRDLLTLRHRRLPRLLHLYGRAHAPSYFEFDSSVPESRRALSGDESRRATSTG
ncbi:MAG TPA: hypothetical protein VLR26_13840 [Frankiaceae bacterium]|nr:hypothetical protein [Frankiaceae bacterium]